MSFRVRFTAEAVRNQNDCVDWIMQRSVSGAHAWLDALSQTMQRLAANPFSFPRAPEDGFCIQELRNAFFGTRRGRTFRAVFYVDGDTVIVTHLRAPDQNLLSSVDFTEGDLL
jgi:plasmid stabilization system protein ParE